MRVLTLSATERGRALAARLPYESSHRAVGAALRQHWDEVDAFVVVLAVGATVRLVAPLLGDKDHDPAVVCVDDAGRFAVVLSGGHRAGGNALATRVGALLGAQPVVTTATDATAVPALDQLPGFTARGARARVTAALLDGRPVRLENPGAWPLPEALERLVPGPPDERAPAVVVSDRLVEPLPDDPPTAVLVPRSLVVGVGTSTGAGADEVAEVVRRVLGRAGLDDAAVESVATIDRRAGHPAIRALAAARQLPVRSFGADTLATVVVPSPSDVVAAAVGTPSVAEAAAVLGAGAEGRLIVAKTADRSVTVAVARRAGPPGALAVVGLGPGDAAHRTPAAETAVRSADVVIGYRAYVEQCADLLAPHQRVERYPLGAELDRGRAGLRHAASGRRVALVCSGDAGIYAMASPLLELAAETGPGGARPFAGVEVTVVPGVSASSVSAALLGAPLGHDHAVVSLSDLHTPWEQIEERLRAAAAADYVLVLFNPRSMRRTWQIEKARAILLEHRPPGTPVGLVTDAGRPAQSVTLTSLGEMACEDVTMTTCVIIGSTTTRHLLGRMVTPRGYDR